MASTNPFDLLGDDDTDDVSQLIAKKALATPTVSDPKQDKQQAKQQPKLPSKPLPPAQAVREAKTDGRGGGRGGGRGFARGRGGGAGFNREPRDSGNNENAFSNGGSGLYGAAPDGDLKSSERRSGYVVGGSRGRGGRRGGYSSGEGGEGERPRRVFERRSGTGRGNDFKRDGAGRGNWGTNTDEVTQDSEEVVGGNDKIVSSEKQPGEEEVIDANKESTVAEAEEKEPEDKEMTLEEYEKVLEEKRKALQALKTEERKVDVKEFASMQQISSKKTNDEIFIKLGSDKDKRKEIADKEERAKKSVSINEFLKPAEGGKHYGAGGRGRGRGRGGARGGYAGGNSPSVPAPSIADQGQFPTLGGK